MPASGVHTQGQSAGISAYRRRHPESYLATAGHDDDLVPVAPHHVEAAFREYLKCGILAQDFVRVLRRRKSPSGLFENVEVPEQPPQDEEHDDGAEAAAAKLLGTPAGGDAAQQSAHGRVPFRLTSPRRRSAYSPVGPQIIYAQIRDTRHEGREGGMEREAPSGPTSTGFARSAPCRRR